MKHDPISNEIFEYHRIQQRLEYENILRNKEMYSKLTIQKAQQKIDEEAIASYKSVVIKNN